MEREKDSRVKVVAFSCKWCSAAAADLAGTSRMQMVPDFTIIPTLCSSRIDPSLILEAFEKGAWGVLVAGCHPGDCHYQTGNYKTRRRVLLLKKVLRGFGIAPDRLRLEWISASEGAKFARVINGFVEQIGQMGPLPLGEARV